MPATGTNKAAVLSHCGLLSGALVPGIKAVRLWITDLAERLPFSILGKKKLLLRVAAQTPDRYVMCPEGCVHIQFAGELWWLVPGVGKERRQIPLGPIKGRWIPTPASDTDLFPQPPQALVLTSSPYPKVRDGKPTVKVNCWDLLSLSTFRLNPLRSRVLFPRRPPAWMGLPPL